MLRSFGEKKELEKQKGPSCVLPLDCHPAEAETAEWLSDALVPLRRPGAQVLLQGRAKGE